MLAPVDQFELDALKMVDSYIVRMGLNAPAEVVPQLRDGYEQQELDTLNLEAAGIKTVIWATGNKFDFSLVKLPVTYEDQCLPWNAELRGSSGRSAYAPMALGERGFDHLQLTNRQPRDASCVPVRMDFRSSRCEHIGLSRK
jgi:hypothetical protein